MGCVGPTPNTRHIKSGKLFDQGDTDAGLFYAGSAVTAGIGGTAMTMGASMTAGTVVLGITPVGWIILGAILTGSSIALAYSGEAAKDDDIEKWLDASTFGKHALPNTPTYADLSEELHALGYALHAPKVIETDWKAPYGWPHYRAEARILLPGYNSTTSHLKVLANGNPVGYDSDNAANHRKARSNENYLVTHIDTSGANGAIAELRHYLPKNGDTVQVVFEVRYRPNRNFDKEYVLHFVVPEPKE